MTWQDAQLEMRKSLTTIYGSREASQISEWVMEYISNTPRIERIMIANHTLSQDQVALWHDCMKELEQGKPVQYISGYAWFMGKKFKVNHHVLIPRPETEELVQMISNENQYRLGLNILDIGTGSGCIPISLKLLIPSANITSIDISEDALQIARENASLLKTDIHLIHADVFDDESLKDLSELDIIVSNPPYIPISEKESLDRNVVEHEPHVALFVPENDPLLFYKSIVEIGKKKLKKKGLIYFETHFKYASEIALLLNENGFQSVVIKDIFGKARFVRGALL